MKNPVLDRLSTENGGASLLRKENLSQVLRCLYQNTPISRAQISKKVSLSAPVVSEIIGELLDAGFALERGLGKSTGGKRPILLDFHQDAAQIVAVDFGGTKAIGAVTDLRANILYEETIQTYQKKGDELAELFLSFIADLLSHCERPILGIGVGTPGLVDETEGLVRFSANLKWENFPLKKIVEERFELPTYVSHDTNAAALGELIFGAGRGTNNSLVMMLGTGIGAGIIINNEIYSGSKYGAGELGHIVVIEDGELCSCGRKGCLETVASGWGMSHQAEMQAKKRQDSLLYELGKTEEYSPIMVEKALLAGDQLAREIVEQAGHYLGVVLASAIHMIIPDRIIIGGGITSFGEPLFEAIVTAINEHSLPLLLTETEVVTSELGKTAGLVGAVASVLRQELSLV